MSKEHPPPYPSDTVPQASVYYPPSQGFSPYPPQQQGQPPYPPQVGYPQQPGYPQQQPPYPQAQQQPFPPQPQQAAYASVYNQPGVAAGAASGMLKDQGFNYVGGDEPTDEMQGFGDKAVRRGFIRKVYGILMCQLLVTAGIIATLMFVEPVKQYCTYNAWPFYTCLVVTIVSIIVLACCESVRRKAPMNFIILGLFTLCEGFLLGIVAGRYNTESVLIAVGITCGVTFALTIFAFQTKIDFTMCGGGLFAVLIIFVIAGFIMAFLPQTKWTVIAYGGAGALIFSLYIVYDTQLMLGGKHKYSLSPEEYVFAALNLYLDIINLFLYILQIVGATNNSN
jgi:FtsH-binding integral membrane protein